MLGKVFDSVDSHSPSLCPLWDPRSFLDSNNNNNNGSGVGGSSSSISNPHNDANFVTANSKIISLPRGGVCMCVWRGGISDQGKKGGRPAFLFFKSIFWDIVAKKAHEKGGRRRRNLFFTHIQQCWDVCLRSLTFAGWSFDVWAF